jgi:hypothetical protein
VTTITFCSFSERKRPPHQESNFQEKTATLCDVSVTFITAITQQIITLTLSEVQLWHWLVGQTLQYAGLGGASLTSSKRRTYAIW